MHEMRMQKKRKLHFRLQTPQHIDHSKPLGKLSRKLGSLAIFTKKKDGCHCNSTWVWHYQPNGSGKVSEETTKNIQNFYLRPFITVWNDDR